MSSTVLSPLVPLEGTHILEKPGRTIHKLFSLCSFVLLLELGVFNFIGVQQSLVILRLYKWTSALEFDLTGLAKMAIKL